MQVTLYEFTGSGHPDPADYAAGILIFTKRTRLQMTPGLLQETLMLSPEEKLQELAAIANTIPSSWEMCDYHFLISGVTRAFTHQLVRTRSASFAQQTMRVLTVVGWEYATGPTIADNPVRATDYQRTMSNIAECYDWLIRDGAAVEDARGVLPTNILTNIVMKLTLRSFVELCRKRSSSRVQGEYRTVLHAMQEAVLEVHPWTSLFLERDADHAAADLDKELVALPDKVQSIRLIKLLDIIRTAS